jgi:hypothetical protein
LAFQNGISIVIGGNNTPQKTNKKPKEGQTKVIEECVILPMSLNKTLIY